MPERLDMIYDLLRDQGKKLDTIIDRYSDMKVIGQIRESRIAVLEGCAKRQEELIRLHMENQESHYNPYYNETYRDKIKRKSPEIATGVSISSIISGLLIAIAKIYGVI